MKIKPLFDRVIVKPLPKETKTAFGLVIPDTVDKEKPMQGEVVATGPGKLLKDGKRGEMSVKVKDIVLFTKYAPDEIELDGQELLVIEQDKILAIISK